MVLRKSFVSAISGALILGAAGAVQARERSFAIGHPPVSVVVTSAQKGAKQFDEATGGEVTLKVYPLTLLSMVETSGGLREGLADVSTPTELSPEVPK